MMVLKPVCAGEVGGLALEQVAKAVVHNTEAFLNATGTRKTGRALESLVFRLFLRAYFAGRKAG